MEKNLEDVITISHELSWIDSFLKYGNSSKRNQEGLGKIQKDRVMEMKNGQLKSKRSSKQI